MRSHPAPSRPQAVMNCAGAREQHVAMQIRPERLGWRQDAAAPSPSGGSARRRASHVDEKSVSKTVCHSPCTLPEAHAR